MHPEEAAGGGSAGEQCIQTMFMRVDFSDSDIRYTRNYSVYAGLGRKNFISQPASSNSHRYTP